MCGSQADSRLPSGLRRMIISGPEPLVSLPAAGFRAHEVLGLEVMVQLMAIHG